MSREPSIVSHLRIRPQPRQAQALDARLEQLLQRTRQARGCRSVSLEYLRDHWLLEGTWRSEVEFRAYCEAAAQRDFGPLLGSGLVREMGFALLAGDGVSS